MSDNEKNPEEQKEPAEKKKPLYQRFQEMPYSLDRVGQPFVSFSPGIVRQAKKAHEENLKRKKTE